MTARTAWEHDGRHLVPDVPATWPTTYDDVVVGGGVVGLSAATELARHGRRVVVLEAAPAIGHGTSGRSTGKLSVLQGTRLSTIEHHHGPDAARAYLSTVLDGAAWLESVLDDRGVDVQRRPAVTWAVRESDVVATRREDAAARRAGLDTRWVREVPGGLPGYGAVVLDDQLQVDALSLTTALAHEAVAAGVDVVVGRRVVAVSGASEPVVTLDDGTDVSTRHVLLASGIPVLDRSLAFATTTPHRSSILAFETTEPHHEMAVSVGSPSRSVRGVPRTVGPSLTLVGGEGHVVGRGGHEGRRVATLRAWAREHLGLEHEVAAWSAQDHRTPDEVPLVGRVAGGRSVTAVTGFGGWGLVAGVGYARHLAAAVAKGHAIPVVPSPRLAGPRSLPSLLQLNASVGAYLAAGWAGALGRPRTSPGEGQAHVGRGTPPVATSRVGGCERSVSAVCPHLGGIVRWNDLEKTWDCPLHGSRFTPDGEVLDGPATRGLARVGPAPDRAEPDGAQTDTPEPATTEGDHP